MKSNYGNGLNLKLNLKYVALQTWIICWASRFLSLVSWQREIECIDSQTLRNIQFIHELKHITAFPQSISKNVCKTGPTPLNVWSIGLVCSYGLSLIPSKTRNERNQKRNMWATHETTHNIWFVTEMLHARDWMKRV